MISSWGGGRWQEPRERRKSEGGRGPRGTHEPESLTQGGRGLPQSHAHKKRICSAHPGLFGVACFLMVEMVNELRISRCRFTKRNPWLVMLSFAPNMSPREFILSPRQGTTTTAGRGLFLWQRRYLGLLWTSLSYPAGRFSLLEGPPFTINIKQSVAAISHSHWDDSCPLPHLRRRPGGRGEL